MAMNHRLTMNLQSCLHLHTYQDIATRAMFFNIVSCSQRIELQHCSKIIEFFIPTPSHTHPSSARKQSLLVEKFNLLRCKLGPGVEYRPL